MMVVGRTAVAAPALVSGAVVVGLWLAAGLVGVAVAQQTCEPQYDGFPFARCSPTETQCEVQCLLSSQTIACSDFGDTEACTPDICTVCTCERRDSDRSIQKVLCEDAVQAWPQGLPLRTNQFTWRVDQGATANIGELRSSLFRPGTSLSVLKLLGVGLTSVAPDTFQHLTDFMLLNIAGTDLVDLPWESLRAIPTLKYIEVFGNKLTAVDFNLLPNNNGIFKAFEAQSNMITSVTPLQPGLVHSSILTLKLDDNLISKPENLTRGMPNLDMLAVGGNRFTYLPRSLFDPNAHSITRLFLSNSAIVHVPFGVITDVMAVPAVGDAHMLVMTGSPSYCESTVRQGTQRPTYLDLTCTCRQHFRDDGIIANIVNATHCPLARKFQCPVQRDGNLPIRVDQFCDGKQDCIDGSDEGFGNGGCRQSGQLRSQDPPNCLYTLLGLNATHNLRFLVQIRSGSVLGRLLIDNLNDKEAAKMKGVLYDVRQTPEDLGARVTGYLLDIPASYAPLPFRAVSFFNTVTDLRIYAAGDSNDEICRTQFSFDNRTRNTQGEWFRFPETVEDNPSLLSTLPNYREAVEGVARIDTTPTPGVSTSAAVSTTSGGSIDRSRGGSDAGAIVGGVVGVLIAISILAAVFYTRRARTKTGPAGVHALAAADIEALDLQQQRIQRELERCNVLIKDLAAPDTADSKLPQAQRSSVVLHEQLGRGAFGVVFRATWRRRGQPREVAVKTFPEGPVPLDDQAAFLVEAQLMGVLRHPCLVAALALCSGDSEPPLLIMEFLQGGNLRDYLRTATATPQLLPTWGQLLHACICIADGMAYLASRNVVHRDLACRNVLVGASLQEDVKISDYGMARYLNQSDYYRQSFDRALPIRWMAPETLEDEIWTTQSDVWSCGVTFWEVLTCGQVASMLWCLPQRATLELTWLFVLGTHTHSDSLTHTHTHTHTHTCTLTNTHSLNSINHTTHSLARARFFSQTPYPKLRTQEVSRAHHTMTTHMPLPPACPMPLYQAVIECWKVDPHARPSFDIVLRHLTQVRESLQASGVLNQQCPPPQAPVKLPEPGSSAATTTTTTTTIASASSPYDSAGTARLILQRSVDATATPHQRSPDHHADGGDDEDDGETRL
ncbi:TK protein kinase [Salpingoeca rosetta]|uniref:TK protein kinase n=1 Tax=Salpingoeca rosetta (strain ATCC 50818 / BSB-021) TaxID=946362 RepID=F2U8N2_SALR5|nr:TK protein kinase [Salpingoeca rosetta]EGD72740.1 TK protein kinase [Salpingoeca rosetta]|eukprot:XP_004994563.1 TK protein kinase [Salpingoeca rosetta]